MQLALPKYPYLIIHSVRWVTVLYAICTLLWISLSDVLVWWWTDNHAHQAVLQTIKGYGFILVSSSCLYGLLRQHARLLLRWQQRIRRHRKALRRLNNDLEKQIRSRTRNLEDTNRELTNFVAAVSHDLRSPLQIITVLLKEFRDDYDSALAEDAQQQLVDIQERIQHLTGLVQALLTLSQASQAPLERERVDITAMVRQIVHHLERAHPEQGVDWQIAEELTGQADPELLRIVFTNLLSNAWKFSAERRPPKIRVDSQQQAEETVFFIQDNGAGFDMRYSQNLFQAFRRFHNKKIIAGFGIGLTSVQRVIHRHGGRIWAEATPEQGACFFFTLGSAAPTTATHDPHRPTDDHQ